jgi:hypothetical protein
MVSLVSPGVQVTVIDQSQYAPTQAGSVPLILLATAQDKLTPGATLASGTTIANAEKIITVTSQRDLVNYFGNPFFAVDASDNPINGDERNEYGLLAAYSALGVTNTCYVQRANVDLAQLEGTSTRPTGDAADGTYWLDTSTTNFGIYEFTQEDGFILKTPSVITSTSYLSSGVPLSSYGSIGDYAVVTTSSDNPVYYKGYDNSWYLVGSKTTASSWSSVVPTVTGNVASPTVTAGSKLIINGNTVTVSSTTLTSAVSAITSAGIPGVTARANSSNQLEIFVNGGTIVYSNAAGNLRGVIDTATSSPSTLQITKGSIFLGANIDCAANLGLLQSPLGSISNSGNTYSYNGPTITFAGYTNPPAWKTSDVTPRPDGSIWFKTTATGNGASWAIKEYSATLDSWTLQSAPLYSSDSAAIYGLDGVGGGASLDAGALYVKYDTLGTTTATFTPYIKNVQGILTITGTVAGGSALSYRANDAFSMSVSVPGSSTLSTATVTIGGSGNVQPATALVSAILSANFPNITAGINSDGQVFVTHLAGGTIQWTQTVGTPMDTAGLNDSARVQELVAGVTYLASPFTPLTYTYSATAPFSDPRDGTLWYYSDPLVADIMINDGAGFKGYRTVTNDARGYNLSLTDANGPIFSASQPVTQSDGTSQLQPGDLWISTSDADLANYPVIYRYDATNGGGGTVYTWNLIDNADDVNASGIVFADARWSATGNVDVITGSLPTITSLITSNYLDPDAPAYQLYARGTLLFNTRRSGFNVKRFDSTGFTSAQLATVTGTETATWFTQSGVDPTTAVPYFGTKAQRSTVVEALKSAITSSTALREEQTEFNLICCPGYPELIQDMITLNNDRVQTAFIIGDSPLDLPSDSTTLNAWANNTNLAVDNGEEGLVSNSEYLGVYYPSGLATNLDGESVVVPPSHMMLRTIIRSDAVSYPWFAPAGVRRGLIDNVTAIGYIDTSDNNTFKSIGVTAGLRDVLYRDRVNPITILPGVGLVAYGQKTRAAQASAMDRINVARLIVYLRTVLAKVASPYIFEPNDTITRSQVQSAFNAVFNDLVAKRAIYDYLVVCDTTNNTPIRIDNNELYIDIAIQPVKAIEFIYIPVRLQNTGAALTIQ